MDWQAWAGKHTSPGKIDEDPYGPSDFIKLHLCNHPWLFQLERFCKQ
jgi:hypothetical protein